MRSTSGVIASSDSGLSARYAGAPPRGTDTTSSRACSDAATHAVNRSSAMPTRPVSPSVASTACARVPKLAPRSLLGTSA